MTKRILVTGATGTLGREVVRQLTDGGRSVRALSRRPRPTGQPAEIEWAVGDLSTGEGIDAAVADVDTIIHCASDFRRGKRNLPGVSRFLEAARGAGVAHLVYISIVGIDRVPVSYYRVKLDEERLIESSGLAWTILRASGKRRLLLPLRLPGAAFRGYRRGGHLTPDHAEGRRTFEEYLATRDLVP